MSGDLLVVTGATAIVCGSFAVFGWLCERVFGKDVWSR